MIDKNEVFRHLKNLNIPKDVDFTLSDIHSAYKLMAKFYHPDTNKSNSSDDKMKKINNSYEFLKNNFEEIKSLNLHSFKSETTKNDRTSNAKQYIRTSFNTSIISKLIKIILWLMLIGMLGGVILSFILALISGAA
jgi:DnaJ-class molecular chaperone